jgi:hypothetical protein
MLKLSRDVVFTTAAAFAVGAFVAFACVGDELPGTGDGGDELAPTVTSSEDTSTTLGATSSATVALELDDGCTGRLKLFEPFLDQLSVACDEQYLYVDADGLTDAQMMVGITAWNQQVPLPQPYTGTNAWRIPLNPVEAATTTATNGQGAVAMALNGVPIFDPTQQDGVYAEDRDPYLIGELDTCGGHAGRGDDYHYHAGPICLVEELAADGEAVAFALDGYPILGFHEAGGTEPASLDACGGHDHNEVGYHTT